MYLEVSIMSIKSVKAVIESAREKIIKANKSRRWTEQRTRREIIAPIIEELGWHIAKGYHARRKYYCLQEYRRGAGVGTGVVDYAFFNQRTTDNPVIIMEAKKLHGNLKIREYPSNVRTFPSDLNPVKQLECYVNAKPSMKEGVAVLTNGNEWRIYDLRRPGGRFCRKRVSTLIITEHDSSWVAQQLHKWLAKENWRPGNAR